MSAPIHPEVLWAQRSSDSVPQKNVVYLTINLPEIIESSLEYNLTATGLSFKAKAGNPGDTLKEYAFTLDFFGEIAPEESSKRLTGRHLALVLRKKDIKIEFWPRLTNKEEKLKFVRTDFSKWVDEDEQDGEPVKEEDDMGDMGDMGGMGGMGGMDMEQLMAQMGGGPGGGGNLEDDEDGPSGDATDESDDDGPPPLEGASGPSV
ncbi:HSP20-like chaperone [Hysterangium stoloniferum]|nr:HSP20-like chaperone [Hysterangium stoloniferum]